MSFEDYKRNRKTLLPFYIRSGLENESSNRNEIRIRNIRDRILNSLKGRDDLFPIYESMILCYPKSKRLIHRVSSKRCGNVYCPFCRNLLRLEHRGAVLSRIAESEIDITYRKSQYLIDGYSVEPIITKHHNKTTNEDLSHITAVLGICDPTIEEVERLITEDTNRWKKVRKNLSKYTDLPLWIEAVYEFELVSWRFLQQSEGSEIKKKQIKQLIDSSGNSEFNHKPFVFVHFHSVSNIPKERISKVFRDYYYIDGKRLIKTDEECGMFVQSFHSNKSVEDNVNKVTSYPFKNALRYKHSFIGNDFTNGEFFTEDEIALMVDLYDKIKPKRSSHNSKLFRSVSNNIGKWEVIEGTLNHYKTLIRSKKKYLKSKDGKYLLGLIAQLMDILSNTKNRNDKLSKIGQIHKELRTYYVMTEIEPNRFILSFIEDLFFMWRRLDGKRTTVQMVSQLMRKLDKLRFKHQSDLKKTPFTSLY